MFMVLIAMLVASSLSVLILGMVIAQVTPTQFERKNSRTLTAAQAGIDAASGSSAGPRRSTSASGDTYGDRAKLPCTNIEGTVGGQPGNPEYVAVVDLLQRRPDRSERHLARGQRARVHRRAPGRRSRRRFALIQSAGAADGVPGLSSTAGDRSLVTTYNFKLTNVNVAGGLIHNYDDGNSATWACASTRTRPRRPPGAPSTSSCATRARPTSSSPTAPTSRSCWPRPRR